MHNHLSNKPTPKKNFTHERIDISEALVFYIPELFDSKIDFNKIHLNKQKFRFRNFFFHINII